MVFFFWRDTDDGVILLLRVEPIQWRIENIFISHFIFLSSCPCLFWPCCDFIFRLAKKLVASLLGWRLGWRLSLYANSV